MLDGAHRSGRRRLARIADELTYAVGVALNRLPRAGHFMSGTYTVVTVTQ
jgi:hypothetical protein